MPANRSNQYALATALAPTALAPAGVDGGANRHGGAYDATALTRAKISLTQAAGAAERRSRLPAPARRGAPG